MDAEINSLLEKHPMQGLPVKGFFENYPVEKFIRKNDFLLIAGTSDYCWAFLSGTDREGLQGVLDEYAFSGMYFANVENWMLPILTQERTVDWALTTTRYFLPFDVVVKSPGETCPALDNRLVHYIFENSPYRDYTSEYYIIDRLQKDVSAGLWIEEELVGWGLTHDDGSLGFLNVMKQHQGKGLGEKILRSLILKKREKNQPVFVNIEPHNYQSISLVKKLGFLPDREISWVKLK